MVESLLPDREDNALAGLLKQPVLRHLQHEADRQKGRIQKRDPADAAPVGGTQFRQLPAAHRGGVKMLSVQFKFPGLRSRGAGRIQLKTGRAGLLPLFERFQIGRSESPDQEIFFLEIHEPDELRVFPGRNIPA